VSSIPDPNAVFEGQEIRYRQRERWERTKREKGDIEETPPKEITEQITEKRSKDRSETRQRVITHCEQRL
jgi:hypothetical protein